MCGYLDKATVFSGADWCAQTAEMPFRMAWAEIVWMQSSLGILRTRGGELETNSESKYIGIKSSSMNRSQVELIPLQY